MTQSEIGEIKAALASIEAKIDALMANQAAQTEEMRKGFERIGEEVLHARHVTKKAVRSLNGG